MLADDYGDRHETIVAVGHDGVMVSSVKDQYVGDVSDYLKYATLRAWSRAGLSTGLAWMRTDADLRPDGTFDLADAPPGLLWASVTADGGESCTRRLLVPDQEQAAVALEIGGLSLRGRVEETGSSQGVQALVQVADPSVRV